MGISLEVCRTRIGNFNVIKIRKSNHVSSPVKQMSPKQNIKRSLILLTVLFLAQLCGGNDSLQFQQLKTSNSVKVKN